MVLNDGSTIQTDWSMIRHAINESSDADKDAVEAMERLSRRYWPAVYAYIRSAGHDVHNAADLTQGFLCDVVLKRKLFHVANPKRGRFRSLLISSLKNYLNEVRRRKGARKEEGERPINPVNMDQARAIESELDFPDAPETAFGMQWTAIIVRDVLRQVREQCIADGLDVHWAIFEHRIVQPILYGGDPTPYHILLTRLEISDAAQAMNMMVTVKRRFARVLLSAVRETVDDPVQVDCELRSLIAALEGQT